MFRRGATHQAAFRSLALAAFSRILAFAMLRQSNGFAQAPFCSLVLVTICNIVMFAVSRQSEGFAEAPFCSLELAAFSRIVMFAIERQSSGFAVTCFCSYAPAMTFRITEIMHLSKTLKNQWKKLWKVEAMNNDCAGRQRLNITSGLAVRGCILEVQGFCSSLLCAGPLSPARDSIYGRLDAQ